MVYFSMKTFEWNHQKNEQLKAERGVGFEDVLDCISKGNLIETVNHPNKGKYPNQKIFIVKIRKYIYIVPFIQDEKTIFLKTIIPSRKMVKKYLGGK